jgi:hypothetical protein
MIAEETEKKITNIKHYIEQSSQSVLDPLFFTFEDDIVTH